ncbi:DUF3368 domain-containing protein [Sulfurimonas sp.]|uniref:DUF3368 domain-containing protein n=1 Tax=Sulfurimonas sp. TaxID=2022749 RepID=UPI0025E2F862|nr:DUF3368 domain-containing protein [Sulfurimonas sp.]
MHVLISDCSVLIDMEEVSLIKEMFSLPYTFSIPDILYHEELDDNSLLMHGLNILSLSSQTVKYKEIITPKYYKASSNDLFLLALAKQETCMLITRNSKLKQIGEEESIVIKGISWIFDELIKHDIISLKKSKEAYCRIFNS